MIDSPPTSADTYALLQVLTPDRTFLCSDSSSNILVLKRLNEDCLHQRRLHPSIRERLAHIRDLPHGRLATLRGVERWDEIPCLVWSWLDGEPWDEALEKSIDDFGSLASSLVEAVDTLHELGVVHGSLQGGNIIVRRDRQVWLTDASPYLYTDPAVDLQAVLDLLLQDQQKLPGPMGDTLTRLLNELRAGSIDLRQLSRALRGLSDPNPAGVQNPVREKKRYRWSSILAAGCAAMIGAAVWISVLHITRSRPVGPTTFPSMKAGARPGS